MSGILNIGVSALTAYQRALNTTGHNVANVDTPGYSRQRVELSSQQPSYSGGSYLGNGVLSSDTVRIYDTFLAGQVRASQSAASDLEVYYKYASQIDPINGNPSSGLNSALQGFFDALQGVADDPSAIPARDLLLSDSQALVDRFHYLDRNLAAATERVHSDMGQVVEQVNGLSQAIAQLNQDIASAPGRAQGHMPNDLLDQRDQALNELSQYVAVSTLEVGDGTINVYLGKGQSLVQGVSANRLAVVDSPELPNHKEIAFSDGKGQSIISDQLAGGELSGLLRVRDEILEPGRNSLGLVALGLSFEMNAQHREGLGLDNRTGLDFFTDLTTSVAYASTTNTGGASLTSLVTDPSKLAASDYRLDYTAANGYQVTRLADDTVVYPPAAAFPGPGDIDGFDLTLTGAMNDGDSFLIRPTANAANRIGVALQDAQSIAAASPMETAPAAGNLGSGQLSLPKIVDPTTVPVALPGPPPAPPVLQLQYLDDLSTVAPPPATGPTTGHGYVFTGGPSGTATFAYDPALDDVLGKTFKLDIGGFSLELTATGQPADSDSFTFVNGAQARVSDNRNALLMTDLQTWRGMLGGTETLQDTFGNYVANTGAKTQQANVNLQAQNKMLEVSKDALEGVKGVNLDEEAANLIRFQQVYQAAAKVIATAGTVFDSLLAVI